MPHSLPFKQSAFYGLRMLVSGSSKSESNFSSLTRGMFCIITDETRVFSVSPATADIPPQKSASFQVTFKPVSSIIESRLTFKI